jgi:glycosyltransferase involved in cell wall biosynthesis
MIEFHKYRTRIIDKYNNKDSKAFVILTACHNKFKYIKDCLNSVISQDYRPICLTWVDDSSTDNSLQYIINCRSLLRDNDIGFTIISNVSKSGCSTAYRIAASQSIGRYFGVLDADDMLMQHSCSFVSSIYEKNKDLTYLWTQFQICNSDMVYKKSGISQPPDPGESMLSMGKVHTFSHWRTFSNKIDKDTVFCSGLKRAVDKYMGYKLEEMGPGAFVNKECYKYREGVRSSVTNKNSKPTWEMVIRGAKKRRMIHHINPFPIRSINV